VTRRRIVEGEVTEAELLQWTRFFVQADIVYGGDLRLYLIDPLGKTPEMAREKLRRYDESRAGHLGLGAASSSADGERRKAKRARIAHHSE